MDMERIFRHLVTAAETALDTDNALVRIGYSDTPYAKIFGQISDAIYETLGENTKTFNESVTGRTLYNEFLTIEERAQVLLHAYEIRVARDYIDGRLNK